MGPNAHFGLFGGGGGGGLANFLIFGGVLGNRMLNSRGTEVSWRPHHTGYISTNKEKQYR